MCQFPAKLATTRHTARHANTSKLTYRQNTVDTHAAAEDAGPRRVSLARASSTMALGTITSRISGLASKVLLAWVLGFGIVNDSYTVATTLPTVINELLLGGVLTSVAVPLLVRAQQAGAREGQAYAQWMITMGGALMTLATVASVLAAPLLTWLYLGSDTRAHATLTTALAWLILPGILFYGLSALFQAVLNARHQFASPAWAPVTNNLVVIATLGLYVLAPGEISLHPVVMGEAKLLILGLGTASGIGVQALIMAVALRRGGFRFAWRWGWDHRLAEFASLAGWVVAYTAISQVGMIVATRVTSQGSPGSVATFTYAWLLSQVPYGVIGVSLLTALLPRLSRSAAAQRHAAFVDDLSVGTRTNAVLLAPPATIMLAAGSPIAVAFFSLGNSSLAEADRLGWTLAAAAVGIVPFAITMLQLRAFYALKDARTPTLINVVMVAVRAALSYAALAVFPAELLAFGVAAAMSVSFVVGAVIGQVWLHARLGGAATTRSLVSLGRALLACAAAWLAAWGVHTGLSTVVGPLGMLAEAWLGLLVYSVVIALVSAGMLWLLKAPELQAVLGKLRR